MTVPADEPDTAAAWIVANFAAISCVDMNPTVNHLTDRASTSGEFTTLLADFLGMRAAEAANAAELVAQAAGADKSIQSQAADIAKRAEKVKPFETIITVATIVEITNNAADVVAESATLIKEVVTKVQWIPEGGVATRPVGLITDYLITLSTQILPAVHRSRYAEEWRGLLFELGTRRARARHVFSIFVGAPRQAWILRRPFKETPLA